MIYADYGATTPLDREVLEKMLPYFTDEYGNPSSAHASGRNASKAVENARKAIAELINAEKNEIYFTSGGTESDNWALTGLKPRHIVTTAIEHHAVLNTCEALRLTGTAVTLVKPEANGIVSPEKIKEAIQPETDLVSVMLANNEIGTIQPIEEIGEICAVCGIPLHTDAVQAAGKLDIDVKRQNISMLSASAHKLYGPKGIGFLYVKNGIRLHNLMQGGAQERDRRPGTVNVPGAVGMAEALKKCVKNKEQYNSHARECAEIIKKRALALDGTYLNGDEEKRLPGNLNFSFAGIRSEGLLFLLDMYGVCASSGSACSAGALTMSHVIKAIRQEETNSLRISVSHLTTLEEAKIIGDKIVQAVEALRRKGNEK